MHNNFRVKNARETSKYKILVGVGKECIVKTHWVVTVLVPTSYIPQLTSPISYSPHISTPKSQPLICGCRYVGFAAASPPTTHPISTRLHPSPPPPHPRMVLRDPCVYFLYPHNNLQTLEWVCIVGMTYINTHCTLYTVHCTYTFLVSPQGA